MRRKAMSILILAAALSSCERVLDKRNFSAVDPQIWQIEGQADLYLNKLYSDNMPGMSLAMNSGYSDETYYANDYIYGQLTESDVGEFSLATYRKIRDINIMLDGMESSSLAAGPRVSMIAQALFMRAWRYWELVRLYGGVPLIMTPQDPFYDDLDVTRSKTSECIEAIVEDLDFGIANLPGRWMSSDDAGRISSGAAAAFKGRILLFWASPQFNPANQADRWQRAYSANLAARDMLESEGYGLEEDFSQVFLVPGFENTEAVMFRSYDANLFAGRWEAAHRPPSGGGTGSNLPTLDLVEAFPMKNGKPITDPGSGYDGVYYWRNRDPRFYHTIAYNGCEWPLNGRAETTQWTYYLNSQEDRRTPATGFYCRKANDPSVHRDDVERTPTDWMEIRFAEVLLNLAECANETGHREEAYNLLWQIRQRAGIDAGEDNSYGLDQDLDQVGMREVIMKERQIELAFENKRYWDLRRRNMYAEDLGPHTPKLNGTSRRGLVVRAKPPYTYLDIDEARDTIDIEIHYEIFFEVELKSMDSQYLINYLQPKYNFFAIPQNILDRSIAVKQTKGWENGEFDPYE